MKTRKNAFDKTTTNMFHSFKRRAAFRNFSVGLVGLGLACLLSLPVLAQPAPIPAPPGMIGWWPGDGDARNIVSNNASLDGFLVNGASASAQGMVDRAFSLDGVGSYVRLPDLLQGQPEGTVEFWFKLNTWDWSGAYAGRYLWTSTLDSPGSNPGYDGMNLGCHAQYTGTGELIFGIWEEPIGWHWARSGQTPETNVWYHVAGTWGANGVCIYINGTLRGSDPYTGGAPGYLQHNQLGCSSYPNSFTDGLIDEFSLYNRALSAAEISAIYAAGSAGKIKPLPQLSIGFSDGAVLVWWSTIAAGFELETSPDPGPNAHWSLFTGGITVIGDQNLAVVAHPSRASFLRLHKL